MQGRLSVGHPVDVASGVLFHLSTDFVLPGRIALSFSRRYSTGLASRAGLFGRGYSLPFEMRVSRDLEGYHLVGEDGESVVAFDGEFDLSDKPLRNQGAFCELFRERDGLALTRWGSGDESWARFEFRPDGDSSWRLVRRVNASGHSIQVEYDEGGRISALWQVRERRGLRLQYSDTGRVSSLILAARGRTRVVAEYSYSGEHLTEVVDAVGAVTRYSYDSGGRRTQEVLPGGGVWIFHYDSNGRCVQLGGSDGFDEKTFDYRDIEQMTEVTDARGNVWRYRWNSIGQVTEATSPLGATSVTAYDEYGRIQAMTGPAGSTHRLQYDTKGDLVQVVDALGGVIQFEYNTDHRVSKIVDKGGFIWERTYDEVGRLVSYRNPVGEEWQFTYNSTGDVVEITNPFGGLERLHYDEQGETRIYIDALGNRYHYEYNEIGVVTSFQDPLGNETRNEYDAGGRLSTVHWPDGTSTRNEYGPNGQLLRRVDRAGRVTTYRSGACANQWTEVVRGSERWSYVWAKEPGQLIELRNAAGETWKFEYDAEGRLARETDYAGHEKAYEHDAAGNLIASTSGSGRTTRYQWDERGNPISAEYADGTRSAFEYDRAGNLVAATDAAGTVRFTRDPLGRAVAEQFRDFALEREFGPLGLPMRLSTSLGHESRYQYDPNGRIAALTIDGVRARIVRDPLGREVVRQLPGGAEIRFEYDAGGRLAEQRVTAAGKETIRRGYSYDRSGLLIAQKDSHWGASRFEYDGGGRLVKSSIAGLPSELYNYDGRGTISAKVGDGLDEKSEVGTGGKIERTGSEQFEYDAEGRTVRRIETGDGHHRTWEYQWDAKDRLIGVTGPDGIHWTYEYDVFDRRIRKVSGDLDCSFRWDGDAMVHELPTDGAIETWSWIYRRSVPFAKQAGKQTWFCVLDHIGTARELVSGKGTVGWRGLVSPWGALLQEQSPNTSCPIRLPGQWADESRLSYNRFRYYDPARMQYLSPDPIRLATGPGLYNYSTNPLLTIDPLGLLAHVFYDDPDGLGRPGTATAVITPSDIGTGTEANSRIRPPGFEGGAHPNHHERGHLIGNQLGGDGNDPRNLVTLTGGTNHPHMENLEARVRAHVEAGNFVELRVTPVYHGDHPVPTHIDYHAVDMATGKVIASERVQNGLHKNYTACSH